MLSPCELAQQSATQTDSESTSDLTSQLRLFAAQRAQNDWLNVAQYCSGRFAEGTFASALAGYRAYLLSGQQETALSPHSSIAQDGLNLHELADQGLAASEIQQTQSSAIALAEDRSAFALEILAAKNNNDTYLLSLSDNQKSVAQIFVSLHPDAADPREKVYSVGNLLEHTQTITDPSTGLSAPTSSVVLMNAARAEVMAMTSNSDGKAGAGLSETGSSSSAQASAEATSREKALRRVAELATLRVYQALKLGYPAFEGALFTS